MLKSAYLKRLMALYALIWRHYFRFCVKKRMSHTLGNIMMVFSKYQIKICFVENLHEAFYFASLSNLPVVKRKRTVFYCRANFQQSTFLFIFFMRIFIIVPTVWDTLFFTQNRKWSRHFNAYSPINLLIKADFNISFGRGLWRYMHWNDVITSGFG